MPFSAEHRIAPWNGGAIPEAAAFVQVRCHDLTRSGFSFFSFTPPDYDRLVGQFSTTVGPIYVAAAVAHCERVLVHPSGMVEHLEGDSDAVGPHIAGAESAVPVFLVGCRFTGRLV